MILAGAFGEHEYEFQHTSAQVHTTETSSNCQDCDAVVDKSLISANVQMIQQQENTADVKHAETCEDLLNHLVQQPPRTARDRDIRDPTEYWAPPPYVDAKFIVSGCFTKAA